MQTAACRPRRTGYHAPGGGPSASARAATALCLAALRARWLPGPAEGVPQRPTGAGVGTVVQPRSSGAGSSSRRPGAGSTPATGTPTPSLPAVPQHTGPRHYIVNVENAAQVVPLGYDLFDTGPDTDELAALPAG